MNDIETQLTELEEQVNRLKTGIDKCFVPSIYVHTFKVAQLMKSIDSIKTTKNEKEMVKKLDTEAFKQFKRLSDGRCSCNVSKDI